MSNAQTTLPASASAPAPFSLPTPPNSTHNTPNLDAQTQSIMTASSTVPLITPPSSIRSPSPNMPPPSFLPEPKQPDHDIDNNIDKTPVPPKRTYSFSRKSQSKSGSTNDPTIDKRQSIQFPISQPASHDNSNTDFGPDETRPRYHSTLSRPAIPRSESKSFSGKLQSLRKKIESELSRKRGQPGSTPSQGKKSNKKAQKGTVAGLRPSPALTVPESMSVADASQLCAAKRTDCVLVVDEEEGLSGIFTAKDLAFRVGT